MKICVVGGGPGSMDFLSSGGIALIKEASVVLTSVRLNEELSALNKNIKVMGILDTISYIREQNSSDATKPLKVVVLASGDVGFYSIASTLRRELGMEFNIELCPGLSSFQVLAAKLSMAYQDWKLVSLHGHDKSIIPYASYYNKTFALTGGKWDVKSIIKELVDKGLSHVKVYVGERLSMEGERITAGRAERLLDRDFDKLAVVLIENKKAVNPYQTFRDEDYTRGKAPMTKEAIRNLSIDALEIAPTDVVWDVGAGCGGVTCAMALKAHESTVYAAEMKEDALEVLRNNIEKLGTFNVDVIEGRAPEVLENLPAPDKVFIGGTTGGLEGTLDIIFNKNPKAIVVVSAIALETIASTINAFKKRNLKIDIMSASIAKAKKLGNYNMMMGENPIYIIRGEKDEEKQNS
ncbi:precorrin-6y C5,15-methyltransferase (decarboxylating) subunit CbiE [Eubacteriales bacterium KG127]